MWYSCKNHSSLQNCIQTNKQRREAHVRRAEPETRRNTSSATGQIARGLVEPKPADSDSPLSGEPETTRAIFGGPSLRRRASQLIAESRTASGGSSSSRRAQQGCSEPVRHRKAEPSHRNKESEFSDELSQCYSMSKFAAATENFSNSYIIYNGVYIIYGRHYLFNSPQPYIIYRGISNADDISKLKEVSHLSHPNLASMAGYCCSDVQTTVGYKNEDYRVLLHQLSYYNISWLQRLNICIDAAKALRCIHSAKIVHGGITPTTILLDSSSSAKLVTFGSVLSHWIVFNDSTLVPRDIAGLTKPTEKTDVFLFGLLLLILFCGKKTDYSNGYPFLLPGKVCQAIKRKTLHLITDLNLADVAEVCLHEFLKVSILCFHSEQDRRPSMDTVLDGLKRARDLQRHSCYEQR